LIEFDLTVYCLNLNNHSWSFTAETLTIFLYLLLLMSEHSRRQNGISTRETF